jgi:glycosyltransferase involved in cell wall biosynthesis
MARKVLLLAHDFPPMAGGGISRPLAFARYLPEFGYDPIVLTRGSTHGRPVDGEPLGLLPPQVSISRIDPDPETDWEALRRRLRGLRPLERVMGKPPHWIADGIAWRISNRWPSSVMTRTWVKPAIALGRELIRQHRPDVLIATGPPFGTLKAGVVLAEQFDLPLIADYRDPWTYAYLWKPQSPTHERDERSWERRVLQRSSRILVVTPTMATRMRVDYPEFAEKVELLMNGYDDVMPGRPVESEPNLRMTIAHVGSLVDIRQPTLLLDAAAVLRQRHPEIAAEMCIRFVGPSSPPVASQSAARGLNGLIEDVGPVSRSMSQHYMRSADLLVLCELASSLSIPGKCYEYLIAGRPILAFATEDSDAAWFLRQSNCARLVGDESPDRVAEILVELWRTWKAGTLRGEVDPIWLAQFHRREGARRLSMIISTALGADSSRAEKANEGVPAS